MNKQQKNYIKAVVGFVLAAIILCAGIMTALYLMREEKGMENLMAPVLKRLIAGILLFGLTVCWRHFLKKSVSKVAGIIVIVLLSLFFARHIIACFFYLENVLIQLMMEFFCYFGTFF